MKKLMLINIVKTDGKKNYNAAGKAKTDVIKTFNKLGADIEYVEFPANASLLKIYISQAKEILSILNRIKKKKPTDIFIQYPGFGVGTKTIGMLVKFLNKHKFALIIHDIDSLRYHGELSERELGILNRADRIIVHTDNMKNYLLSKGVKSEMDVMWLFDYYAKDDIPPRDATKNEGVVFAGNLSKSEFLNEIGATLYPHKLFLYGLPVEKQWEEGIEYVGKFEPDDISDIKGGWGLVWDGSSLDTCNGLMGDYLKYNSSHKASLYLASGKPVIVWKKSAIAPYIENNHLGITIDSLREIPKRLIQISDDQYLEYKNSVKAIQNRLRNGEMLLSMLGIDR